MWEIWNYIEKDFHVLPMYILDRLIWILVIISLNILTVQLVVSNKDYLSTCFSDQLKRDRLTFYSDFNTERMSSGKDEANAEEGQGENKEEELLSGGLPPEVLAQLAAEVPDIELDLSTNNKKLISGLGNTLPFAPVVNNLRAMGQAQAAMLPQQGALPQGNAQGQGQGAVQGQPNRGQGQPNQGQGQGQGAQPPPRRYVLEDGDLAYSDGTQTMLC